MLDCPKESTDCQLIIPNNSIKICIDSRDAVEAHSCVDTNNEISHDEEYTTILKYSMALLFKSKVFVN